jgi:hypothetical protein
MISLAVQLRPNELRAPNFELRHVPFTRPQPPSRCLGYRARGCLSHFLCCLHNALLQLLALLCERLRLAAYELALKLDQFLRFSHTNDFVRKILADLCRRDFCSPVRGSSASHI